MTVIAVADLGASSIRVACVDHSGRLLALSSRGLRSQHDRDRSEQDAGAWWSAFLELAQRTSAAVGGRPDAVVVTGGTRTQVVVDDAGRPLRPALMWDDGRAAAEARTLAQRTGDVRINPYHPLARLAWMAVREPGILGKARAVLQPKEYLVMRLTGNAVSDPVSNWLIAGRDGRLDETLLSAAGIDGGLLPAIRPIHARVGEVRCDATELAALAGAPVFCGSMDTWCCTLALGANLAGGRYILSGTSEVVGVISDRETTVDGLLTVPWGDGLWHLGGPSQCGGTTIDWVRRTLGFGGANLDELLGASSADTATPVFIPYLSGERTPFWNPELRGAWVGLDLSHGPADLFRSAVEGIAFHDRLILDRIPTGRDDAAREIRIGGGLARSGYWCQVRADVLDCVVARGAAEEPGLIGAAMVGLRGLGRFADWPQAQAALSAVEHRFRPDQRQVERYRDAYARYRELTEDRGA